MSNWLIANWCRRKPVPWYNAPEVARRCAFTEEEREFLDQFKSLKEFAEVLTCCKGYHEWTLRRTMLTVQDGIAFFHKSRQPRNPPKKSPLRYC